MINPKMLLVVAAVAMAGAAGPAIAQDGKPSREARASAMFDRMDADKDGMISRAEWDAARAAMAERRGKQGGRGGWASLDSDGDGQLSAAEWQAAGRPAERFAAMDADNDGVLTREEIMTARQARMAARTE